MYKYFVEQSGNIEYWDLMGKRSAMKKVFKRLSLAMPNDDYVGVEVQVYGGKIIGGGVLDCLTVDSAIYSGFFDEYGSDELELIFD